MYVDGELLDTANDLCASEDEPTLVRVIGQNDQVAAFVKPTGEIAIRVNGERVTGQQAYAVASD